MSIVICPELACLTVARAAETSNPLDGATNDLPPITPGSPPIFLGGQRRRGIVLAGRGPDGLRVIAREVAEQLMGET